MADLLSSISSLSNFSSFSGLLPSNNATSGIGSGSGSSALDIPAQIPQTERAFTTRSRSVNYLDGGGDRGQRAYIKVLTTDTTVSLNRVGNGHDAQPTSLGNASGGVLNDAINGANGYANFLLTDMRCNLEEKLQVIEVFGDAEVSYYFGRQPILFDFGGVLLDSVDNNWFIQWLEMYAQVMRGTQLARNYELIKIVLPNMTLIGTVTRMGFAQNSARDVDIPFNFGFLVKQIIPQPVTLPNKPLTNDPVIDWDKASGFLSQSGINGIKVASAQQKFDDLRNTIGNPLSTTSDYSSALTNFGQGVSTYDINNEYLGGNITQFGNGLGSDTGSSTTTSSNTSSSLFSGITSNLTGVRASLFSPVYGVLSSLTKLIRNVTGNVGGVIGTFTNPVRDILRDVRNISNQAIGVVNLINNSINGITNQVNNFNNEILSTVTLLRKTAGVITNAPESISSSIRRLVSTGRMPLTSGFLTSKDFKTLPNGTRTNSKIALLNSGPPHTPEQGARI